MATNGTNCPPYASLAARVVFIVTLSRRMRVMLFDRGQFFTTSLCKYTMTPARLAALKFESL